MTTFLLPSPRRRCLPGAMFVVLAALAWSTGWAQAERPRASQAELATRLAQMRSDPKARQSAMKTGREVAAVCANCHGDSGVSTKPEVPNLAAQNASYLAEQMRLFAAGQRHKEFMERMGRAMNTEETAATALFYAAQTVPPRPAGDAAQAGRGRELYKRLCTECHGNAGRGNAELARLAGQQGPYVVTSMKRYRDAKAGAPRLDKEMVENSRRLTDADLDALAAYIGSMP